MMRARELAIATLLFGAAAACKKSPPLPAAEDQVDAGSSSTMGVAAWGDLQLRVPTGADSHGGPDRFDLSVHAHTRSPSTLSIRKITADEHATLARTTPTKVVLSGGRLAYRIDRFEGGSGGPEATLVGAIEIGGGTYRVECHAQSELTPRGDWCLPYVLTLQHR